MSDIQIFHFACPNIQFYISKYSISYIKMFKVLFAAGHLDWRRNISLRGFCFWGNKTFLIYGETIHSTIREVFNKCQTLLRKCYDLIPSSAECFLSQLPPVAIPPSRKYFLDAIASSLHLPRFQINWALDSRALGPKYLPSKSGEFGLPLPHSVSE